MTQDPYKPPTTESAPLGITPRPYNNALVVIRLLGFYFVITGVMGFAYILFAVFAQVSGAPEWLMNPPLYFAAQGVFGNPIYIIGGVVLLAQSQSIARFITKLCEPEDAA